MSFLSSSIVVGFALAATAPIIAQNGPPPTFAEVLQQHHVALTRTALLAALRSPEAEVRELAAVQLAEDKAVDAIPAIKRALAAETVPRARVNIALALGLLGDQAGQDELKKACADKDLAPELRLYAVRYMFNLHFQKEEHCLAAAEEIVDSMNVDFGDRISAVALLPDFHNLTPEESQTVFELVIHRLDDPEPAVQMEASGALASLGDASAIPYLKAAIAREKEEAIRSVFELNLEKLEKKTKD